jgi:hypothetical protein
VTFPVTLSRGDKLTASVTSGRPFTAARTARCRSPPDPRSPLRYRCPSTGTAPNKG